MTATLASSRALVAGASQYMSSVLVGVLLAPVLPDVAVDLGGAARPWWTNPALRIGSLLLVLVVCVLAYRAQLAVTRRRALRAGYALSGIGRRDVLVLPIGLRSGYTPRDRRTGEKTVIEWLVDSSRPAHVIGVATPQVNDLLPGIRMGLAADGVRFDSVEIRDAGDPDTAVADAQSLVISMVQSRSLTGRTCYVDTTGGSVPMSLAMLRVGSLLGAECTYVSSEYKDRALVPGSQKGRAFDPVALLTATP
jgi:hypothetical protein